MKISVQSLATRKELLDRIRNSLGLPAGQASVPGNLAPWTAPGAAPSEVSDTLAYFENELRAVGGSTHRAAGRSQIMSVLAGILTDRGSGAVLSRNPLLAALDIEGILTDMAVPVAKWTANPAADPGPEAAREYRDRSFSAGVGITGVDFALAESGTLLLTSLTEGSQLASLAPPVHIALYRREQVVATMEEVLARLPDPGTGASPGSGRSIVFITGTSRTADIEQILIRGVHGPRELHAVLVEE